MVTADPGGGGVVITVAVHLVVHPGEGGMVVATHWARSEQPVVTVVVAGGVVITVAVHFVVQPAGGGMVVAVQ